MSQPLFPVQEIGSLAKPVWRIQALGGKPASPGAYAEAKALADEFRLPDGARLLELVRRGARTPEEKDELRAFSSRLAIAMEEKVGLDLVYDGEQHRTEMYDFAVKRIHNFQPRGYVRSFDNRYYLKQAVAGPVGIDEPYHLDEFLFMRKHATRHIKVPITGAYTLMDWSYDEHYFSHVQGQHRTPRAVLNEARRLFGIDLARKVIRPNVQALVEAGCHSIQIDEPAMTTKPDEVPLAVETFNESVRGLEGRFTLHVCFSDYRLLFPHILDLKNCAQFTLEYANKDSHKLGTKPEDRPGFATVGLFREHEAPFEVGAGLVDVHTDELESPELIRDRLLFAAQARGDPAKVYANPDCGLRTRTWQVARAKLEAIVAGTGLARAALEGRKVTLAR